MKTVSVKMSRELLEQIAFIQAEYQQRLGVSISTSDVIRMSIQRKYAHMEENKNKHLVYVDKE